MRILIIGSNGFLGSYLTNALENTSHEWISFDLSLGNDICNSAHFKTIEGKIDVVVHLASMTFVPDSYNHPYSFFHVNSEGTLNVLEFCRINGAKLVYLSSYVYGIPQYSPIDEHHPLDAFNPYCASKLISENLCQYYNRFWKVPVIVLRPFNLYGFGQKNTFLISQIVEQAQSGHIQVKETSPRRDFVYVTDVAKAIIKTVEYQTSDFDVFNVATGKSHSVQDAIDLICQYFPGVEITIENQSRKNEVSDTVANISKIKNTLGWQPLIDFQSGIKLMVDSYLSKK